MINKNLNIKIIPKKAAELTYNKLQQKGNAIPFSTKIQYLYSHYTLIKCPTSQGAKAQLVVHLR